MNIDAKVLELCKKEVVRERGFMGIEIEFLSGRIISLKARNFGRGFETFYVEV